MSLKMFPILVSALLLTALECPSSWVQVLQNSSQEMKQQLEKNKNWVSTVARKAKSRAGIPALLRAASVSSVLGAPFRTEESPNQFIWLKRHIPYYPSHWDSGSSQNTWGYTVAEQISDSLAALRETAQYYMGLDRFAFDPSTAALDGVSQQSVL